METKPVANNKVQHARSRKKPLLLTLIVVVAVVVLGAIAFLLIPDKYELSGKIVNDFNQPVENVKIVAGDTTTTTNEKGEYTLLGLRQNDSIAIEIPENYSYQPAEVTVDYNKSESLGFKEHSISQDISLKFAVKDFANELLTNQKFTRHNNIWAMLDKPSQQVYGSEAAYEEYFKALFNDYAPGQKTKDYKVFDSEIVVRPTWKSPHGVEYTNVFEVPYESTNFNGTSSGSTLYVIPSNNQLVTVSSVTPEDYKEMRGILVDEGYLEK